MRLTLIGIKLWSMWLTISGQWNKDWNWSQIKRHFTHNIFLYDPRKYAMVFRNDPSGYVHVISVTRK